MRDFFQEETILHPTTRFWPISR